MRTLPLLSAVALAAFALDACYTPRDVRPAAVAKAKAMVQTDLPKLAARIAGGPRDRTRLTREFQAYLAKHPGVYGVALAPVPAEGAAFYGYRRGGGFATRELAPPAYAYATMEWYRKPLALAGPHWSTPYFDRDGGDVWMQTYSVPMAGGVLTNDVPVYGPRGD